LLYPLEILDIQDKSWTPLKSWTPAKRFRICRNDKSANGV